MNRDVKELYEEFVEALADLCEIEKDSTLKLFCEHGAEKIFNEPELLGLNEEKTNLVKKAFKFIMLTQQLEDFADGTENDL